MERVHIDVVTERDVHKPGEFVKGLVNVNSPNPLEVDAITTRLVGVASVSFVSKDDHSFVSRSVIIDQKKELWHYFPIGHMLDMGVDENSNETHRISGRASFNFNFSVPHSAPPSFFCSGSPVSVKYTLEVQLSLKGEHLLRHDHPIVVLRNDIPALLNKPAKSSYAKQFHYAKGREVWLGCDLQKTVFTTTERIHAGISLVNKWKRSIKYVHLSIIRKIVAEGNFIDNGDIREKHTVLFDTTGVGLPPEKTKVVVGESYRFRTGLHVPALPPSCKVNGLMTCDYLLNIAVGRAHNYVIASMRIPITIVTPESCRQRKPSTEHVLIDITPSSELSADVVKI